MSLSSNTLVHFTDTPEKLIGILSKGFRPKYCLEQLETKEDSYLKSDAITLAYPMVSFCDIPLSEIKKHIERYGSYGIGLKKEWAMKKGMNPVLYYDKDSNLVNIIRSQLTNIISKNLTKSELGKAFITLLSYSKNYEGLLLRKNESNPNYRFSDEREWRYVPTESELEKYSASPYVYLDEYNSEEAKKLKNLCFKNFYLKFKIDDIKYIIVKTDDDISVILDVIKKVANGKFYSVEKLFTRIITSDQIITDF